MGFTAHSISKRMEQETESQASKISDQISSNKLLLTDPLKGSSLNLKMCYRNLRLPVGNFLIFIVN